MKVYDIEAKASEVLQDAGNLVWSSEQIWGWLHEAELAIVAVRPDASASVKKVTLAAGTRQSIAGITGAMRVLDVIRNVGASDEPGSALRMGHRASLDAFNPDWHTDTQVLSPTQYLFDDRDPKTFYVVPPSNGSGYIEVVCSITPTAYDTGDLNQVIGINDTYAPAMLDWALYRAFCRDSEMTPNYQRGQAHRASFNDLLGVKSNSDIAVSPNNKGDNR